MAITLLRHDKHKVLDLIEQALKLLAFSKLSRLEREQTLQHLAAMRLEPREMDVQCQLAASPDGKTVLAITCQFRGL